jgi:hypothetical protein
MIDIKIHLQIGKNKKEMRTYNDRGDGDFDLSLISHAQFNVSLCNALKVPQPSIVSQHRFIFLLQKNPKVSSINNGV